MHDADGITRYQTAPGHADLSERLRLVTQALTDDVAPAEIIDIVVHQGMAGMGASGGHAGVKREDYLHPVAAVGISQSLLRNLGAVTLERTLPLCQAARTGEPVWVRNRRDGLRRFPDLRAASESARAWAALPLRAGGATFGALGLSFERDMTFDQGEQHFLSTMSDVAALALSRWYAVPPDDTVGIESDRGLAELDSLLAIARVEGILAVDSRGVVVRVNGRLCEMFGYAGADLLGQPLELLLPPRHRQAHIGMRQKYLAEPGPRPMGGGAALLGQRSDGSVFPIDVSLSPCATSHGLYVLAVVREDSQR